MKYSVSNSSLFIKLVFFINSNWNHLKTKIPNYVYRLQSWWHCIQGLSLCYIVVCNNNSFCWIWEFSQLWKIHNFFCFEHGWVWVSDFHKVNRKPFLLDFCKAFPILTIIKGELAYISQIVPIYLIVGDGLWEITFVGWYFIWNSTERCDWLRKSLLDT